jgi:hypothetical protein
MVRDRIGNVLAAGDKVIANLPDTSIIGFISEVQDAGVLRATAGGQLEPSPGRILVSCVIALPVDANYHANRSTREGVRRRPRSNASNS